MLALAVLASFGAIPPSTAADSIVELDGLWYFRCDANDGAAFSHIPVPAWWDTVYGGGWMTDCFSAVYFRTVTVPAAAAGKALFVRFASVDQVGHVFVDGELCGSHVGGGLAFELQISANRDNACAAVAGSAFTLRVNVSGGALPPIMDARGLPPCAKLTKADCPCPSSPSLTNETKCIWDNQVVPGGKCVGVPSHPVGWYGQEQRWGIGDSVTLLAVGNVNIQTVHAVANLSALTLTVSYTLRNLLGTALSSLISTVLTGLSLDRCGLTQP